MILVSAMMKMFCILVVTQLLSVEQSLISHSVSFQHLLTKYSQTDTGTIEK
jgi:hypothetical protein